MTRAVISLWLVIASVACLRDYAPPPRKYPGRDTVVRMVSDRGLCSAVQIAPHIALTAAHCFPDEAGRALILPQIGEALVIVHVLTIPGRDLAVVRTAGALPGPFATVRAGVDVGERVTSYGACEPGVKDHTIVAAFGTMVAAQGALSVCPGDSGGGWFDKQGRLVGITSQRSHPKARVRQSSATALGGIGAAIEAINPG